MLIRDWLWFASSLDLWFSYSGIMALCMWFNGKLWFAGWQKKELDLTKSIKYLVHSYFSCWIWSDIFLYYLKTKSFNFFNTGGFLFQFITHFQILQCWKLFTEISYLKTVTLIFYIHVVCESNIHIFELFHEFEQCKVVQMLNAIQKKKKKSSKTTDVKTNHF